MKKAINIIKPFFVIALYFVFSGICGLIIDKYFSNINNIVLSLLYLAVTLVITLIICLFYRNALKNDFADFKQNYKKYLKKAFLYWMIGLMIMFAANYIISIFTDVIAENETLNRDALFNMPLYSILSVSIIGPIAEELMFREGFRNLTKSTLFNALFSGVLFAYMHVAMAGDYIYIIPYASIGIAFSLILRETKNIYSSICLHIFHNSISIILILLMSFIGIS